MIYSLSFLDGLFNLSWKSSFPQVVPEIYCAFIPWLICSSSHWGVQVLRCHLRLSCISSCWIGHLSLYLLRLQYCLYTTLDVRKLRSPELCKLSAENYHEPRPRHLTCSYLFGVANKYSYNGVICRQSLPRLTNTCSLLSAMDKPTVEMSEKTTQDARAEGD